MEFRANEPLQWDLETPEFSECMNSCRLIEEWLRCFLLCNGWSDLEVICIWKSCVLWYTPISFPCCLLLHALELHEMQPVVFICTRAAARCHNLQKHLYFWVADFLFYLIAICHPLEDEQPARTLSTLGCSKWDCVVTDQCRGGLHRFALDYLEGSFILASSVWNRECRWGNSEPN